MPDHLVAQEELKADLIADIYQDDLKVGAVGVGPWTCEGAGKSGCRASGVELAGPRRSRTS